MNLANWSELQESTKEMLTPEDINRLYNEHRHAIHMKNGYKESSLIDDDVNQMVYPRNPGKMKMLQSLILEAIESYTNILPYNREEYEALMQKLFTTLDTKSAIIVTNHATFANIPILITELHKYAKIHNKKGVRDRINTIVGPALLTQSQKRMGQAISNLRKTIPSTKQSEIPVFDEAVQKGQLTENPLHKIKKEFIKHFTKAWSEAGNIFLLAPTGTRDILEWSQYKDIQSISFADDESIQTTLKVINNFVQQGNMIILAGVNEAAMKTPGKTHEKNHSRTEWSTHVMLKELTPEMCDQLIKEKKFMQELAGLVRNNYGVSIWQALSASQLKEQEAIAKKKLQELADPLHTAYEFKDYTFVDTIKKKIVRKIFGIFDRG